jgi:alpha-tubulin suppressor-like RCC1 family protein
MPTARPWLRLTLIAALFGACGQPTDTTSSSQSDSQLGDAPTVTSVVPSHLPPTTTFDVQINGTGFTSDAIVTFELSGVADQGVRVDSSQYVNSTRIIATVTVAANAKLILYDVAVTERAHKKGIGTETFQVSVDPVYSVEVRPAAATLTVGTSFLLLARTRTGDSLYQPVVTDRLVTWKSSNTGVATIDATGLVTGVSTGSASITATSEGISGTAPVTVAVAASIAPVASVTSGYKTSCALNSSGTAFCWGDGGVGQLGNGALAPSSSPIPVSGGLSFTSVSPAIFHGCGLAAGGAAYCWGRNDQGALGDGSLTQRLTPMLVSGGLQFTVIKTGYHFSCGLIASGAAYCWGQGQFGVLGNGTNSVSTIPVLVSGGHTFTALAAGFQHACAIDTSGAAWCWGDNRNRGLGDGTTANANTPVQVLGNVTFGSLTAGEGSTCGLTPAGAAYCWGWNNYGELGDGTSGTGTSRGNPAPVTGGLAFVSLRAGNIHVCGLTSSGAVYCWGDNSHGELGDGTVVAKTVPVLASGGLSFSAITSGLYLTCGLSTGNVAYCWGYGNLGQLGNGATSDSNVPTRVGGQP